MKKEDYAKVIIYLQNKNFTVITTFLKKLTKILQFNFDICD